MCVTISAIFKTIIIEMHFLEHTTTLKYIFLRLYQILSEFIANFVHIYIFGHFYVLNIVYFNVCLISHIGWMLSKWN